MINKHLERMIKLDKEELIDEIKYPMKLEYYITESEIEEQDELQGIKAYGIEIVKLTGGLEVERELVRNYCCNENTARNTICLLADNSVTPSGLHLVLDNLIGV